MTLETSLFKPVFEASSLPSDVCLRAAWLRALGKQHSQLPNSAVVCSQHFLDDEIYETESGLRQIATGAVPSTVQVCMICLDTDSKLYPMSKHKLEEAYERLTGYPLYDQGNLKRTLCVKCAQRLINFSRFRDNSLRARALMMDLVEKHELITRRHIKGINRTKNQLKSNFVVKTLGPDHCDLYILDSSDKQTESEPIKRENEESYDSPVDEDMEVAEEDDDTADNVNDEFVACNEECFSDDSIMLETKLLDDVICKALENPVFAEQVAEIPDLLKCESAAFQCTLCSEEFVSEHAYMQHMRMHDQQNSDGNADCSTSQVCKPHTAVSSSHSPHFTENKQAIPLSQASSLSVHSPSAHSPQTAVAPLSARLATSNGNKVQAEDADTVQKSKPLFKINNVELNNQLFDTNNVTDINRLTDCVVILYDIFKKPEEGVPIQGESLATMRPSISSWDSQRHIEKASKDFNCQAVSRNEDTRHTIGDIQPVTNKLKVTELNVTKISQSKSYCSNNYNSEDSLLTDKNGYICDVCRHKFKRKSVLVKHIKTHNEVKPFTFEFCQFKAIHKFSLKKHMQTHTGDKPFTCELCDYKCTQNSNLVRHMRTHTVI
ncbi:gastrula zinc finger protein xFG20-1-like [Maniola jurtina]|uniref:gastrula zinc finger protein xFG20-1-like n=1 Tax=Maniola jurtina TaxID=191418 RepID=UPI001E687937|nr:gastrula zinc finger protein xFG20-1-like [Maniola jurtina]